MWCFNRSRFCAFLVILALNALLSCANYTDSYGRAIASKAFQASRGPIAFIPEIRNYNASEMYFYSILTQSFMNDGYTVIERPQISSVMDELAIDQTGVIADSNRVLSGAGSPSVIKELGKLYGIEILCFFGRWENRAAYLRFVNCETAEIIAVLSFSGADSERFDENTGRLFCLALKYAAELEGDPKYLYLNVSPYKFYKSISYDVDEIIYQKQYDNNWFTLYTKN